ncbi:SMI1/KNR4 family protein [Solibacillus cecembensis]|uniref:SMI1/KNR4 family protein n=1 Tax=Solibacillus cecembensis TaxID=459347 RepID=UPI003A9FF39D
MDFSNLIIGMVNKGVSKKKVCEVELEIGFSLPEVFKILLRYADGFITDEGVHIYGTQEIIERNLTYEVFEYAPGYIAIGDDSGGRVLLMRQEPNKVEILIVDSGDMNPKNASLISTDIIQWIKSGLNINTNEKTDVNWSYNCKVVVVNTLDGGIKDLIRIKSIFGLNIPTSELIKGLKSLPYVLIEEYPYGKAKKLIEKLGNLNLEIELL